MSDEQQDERYKRLGEEVTRMQGDLAAANATLAYLLFRLEGRDSNLKGFFERIEGVRQHARHASEIRFHGLTIEGIDRYSNGIVQHFDALVSRPQGD